jgi:methionyl-tRNA formyltransferase
MGTRAVVITQDDPFYMPLFFESFLQTVSERIEIPAIVLLDPFDESLPALVRRMYGLYGPKNFVRRGVDFTYRSIVDSICGGYSVDSVAQQHGVQTEDCKSVNTDEFVAAIETADVDVLLSVSSPEIFEPEILSAPDWGCLNVHTADLPKYRGMLPTFWALYHGEDEIGVTVHAMKEEIDRGEIVRQTTFPIEGSETLDSVIAQGKHVGGQLAANALADIEHSTVAPTPVQGEGSYFSFPTAEERREFQRRGGRLL